MLSTLIQRYSKNHFIFGPLQNRESNCNFTDSQMPHFMIVLILCINLLNLFWIKMSIFEEYGAFKKKGIFVSKKKFINLYMVLEELLPRKMSFFLLLLRNMYVVGTH